LGNSWYPNSTWLEWFGCGVAHWIFRVSFLNGQSRANICVDFAGPLKSMEFTATWPDSSSVLELSLQKGVAITIAIDTSMIPFVLPEGRPDGPGNLRGNRGHFIKLLTLEFGPDWTCRTGGIDRFVLHGELFRPRYCMNI